jgi:predicted ribosomally synthesized peptide with nif11-like leader
MSRAEVQRFVSDMRTNPTLQQAVAASGGGVQNVVNTAIQRGYNVTMDEARQYIRERTSHLTDAELDVLAGGKGSPPPGVTLQVNTVQSAANVSSVVNVAEAVEAAVAASSAVAAAEAAVAVVAAAVIVIP